MEFWRFCFPFAANKRESLFSISSMQLWNYGNMETWTRRHGDMETLNQGNMKTWRHGDIETWRHGDMEKWRHGDMETWTWRHQTENRKWMPRRFSLIRLPFAHHANGSLSILWRRNKRKLSVCKQTKQTKETCPSTSACCQHSSCADLFHPTLPAEACRSATLLPQPLQLASDRQQTALHIIIPLGALPWVHCLGWLSMELCEARGRVEIPSFM